MLKKGDPANKANFKEEKIEQAFKELSNLCITCFYYTSSKFS